jgi:hypothetical protein
MSDEQIHFEPYLYLPALTHTAAIIAWGGFYFEVEGSLDEGKWDDEPLEDDELPDGRKQSIGERSEPYGAAQVELTETGSGERRLIPGELNANHAVIRHLKPDTEYRYRVLVRDQHGQESEWAAGPRRDWHFRGKRGGLWRRPEGQDRRYENLFRTFPDPATSISKLTFAVIGDFGRGVSKPAKDGSARCQRQIAEALERAVNEQGARLILTTGDNIYAQRNWLIFSSDSGEEDDDWFFTYFQPYRYLINRVPVFPAFGNHDDDENEELDDRDQLYDNLYLRTHFKHLCNPSEASAEPGLFYRFRYGSDIECICLDTSKGDLFGQRYFERPENQPFLDQAFSAVPPRWRIPFLHHPPYSAGPQHYNKDDVIKHLVPRFKQGGVRVVFSGHEHNFQYSRDAGIDYFVTGGGGKYRAGAPNQTENAKTQVWGGNDEGHFLVVEIDGAQMKVTPYGHLANGQLRPIKVNVVAGSQHAPPFVTHLD